jgi:hypothetical protein
MSMQRCLLFGVHGEVAAHPYSAHTRDYLDPQGKSTAYHCLYVALRI